MPSTPSVRPDDLLWVVQDVCTLHSYNILTSTGSATEQFICIEPEELRGRGRSRRRSIQRGEPGSAPRSGSVCLAGTSWLNSDVINEVLGRFGAARRFEPPVSIDYVGAERVCAMDGMLSLIHI